MKKKRWYQGTPGAILFLILFFPVGLFLMWKYTSWPRVAKGIVSGFFAVALIGAMARQPEPVQPPTQDTNSVDAQTKPPVQISDDVSAPPAEQTPEPAQAPEPEQTPEQTPSAEPAQAPEPAQTPSADPAPAPEPSQAEVTSPSPAVTEPPQSEAPASTTPPPSDSTGSSSSSSSSRNVYVTKSGKRYHYDSSCNGGTYYESTLEAAKNRGLTPCKKCT